ncbi:MAG TPA: hypothetical protein VFM02_01080 [Candidatus Paceibacterota bacterium]|nr:hypothetical protein [Candidatus Paceibacterota bacterium]
MPTTDMQALFLSPVFSNFSEYNTNIGTHPAFPWKQRKGFQKLQNQGEKPVDYKLTFTLMSDEHKQKANHPDWEPLPWRAWGSWFSWGSPVGLGLGWALFIIPLGIFLLLLHQAGISI